jgi:hypothetical protein
MSSYRKRSVLLSLLFLSAAVSNALTASAQASQTRRRGSTTTKRASSLTRPVNEVDLQLLARLRAMRDCWVDPYRMLPSESPNRISEMAFYRCGSDYALRLAEARAAVDYASETINNAAIRGEATSAMNVFKDLDVLRQFFNRNLLSSLTENTSVSDIYPIVHKYNISYSQDKTSKAEIYRQMMPHRRMYVDRLAALVTNAPKDQNPTLTPEQQTAVTDDLTWTRAARDMSYEWYLRWYPQGRHAEEARQSIARKSEIQKERDDRLKRIRKELELVTQKLFEAYVRGDKATYGSFLSVSFPSRAMFIERLKPQAEVASFEIRDFQVKRYDPDYEMYRATMNVHYVSIFNKKRDYRNYILFLKTDRAWEIVEWH